MHTVKHTSCTHTSICHAQHNHMACITQTYLMHIKHKPSGFLSCWCWCLHSVSYTTLFFWHPQAGNPTIQTQDSWLSHLLLDPTFGIHSHKTLDTAHPCHLLKAKWKPSSSHSISILTNISTQFLLQCVCVRVRARVCVCSEFYFIFIILYVNCFGRTMLYMCIEYHI